MNRTTDGNGCAGSEAGARIRALTGFTLVEVAIALAVVAIGVLSVFVLVSTGLDSSARALTETESAVFAENVFSGLRAHSVKEAEKGTGYWEAFWTGFGSNETIAVTVTAYKAWVTPSFPYRQGRSSVTWFTNMAILANKVRTNEYVNYSFRNNAPTNLVDHALRYQLDVGFNNKAIPLVANRFWTNRVELTLKVWPGKFGARSDEDALVYYTEIENPGDL